MDMQCDSQRSQQIDMRVADTKNEAKTENIMWLAECDQIMMYSFHLGISFERVLRDFNVERPSSIMPITS